jgi:hypothetical protein
MSERADRNPETSYESSDWHVPAIAIVMAMLLLLVAIAVLALYFGFRTAALDVQRSLTVAMPPPALQTDPRRDLARLHAHDEQLRVFSLKAAHAHVLDHARTQRAGRVGRCTGWEVIRGSSLELKVAGPSMLGTGCPDRHTFLFKRSSSLPTTHDRDACPRESGFVPRR